MSDLISKWTVVRMLQSRASDQRRWGQPVNREIAKELDAVRAEVKDLPVDSEVQRLREALERIDSIRESLPIGTEFCRAFEKAERLASDALSPQKGETQDEN